MTNTRWNPRWDWQQSYERIVDAVPGNYSPNHQAIYIYDDAGIALRFIRLYQTGDFRELVLHDLAIVNLSWTAARDLHDRLGQELEKRAALGKSVPVATSIPHPQFGDSEGPTPLEYVDMTDPAQEEAMYQHLHEKYGAKPKPTRKRSVNRTKSKKV